MQLDSWRIAAVPLLLALTTLAITIPVSAADPPAGTDADERPYVLKDGASAPLYSYRDAIREHVSVSARDGDGDGERDWVAVDIIRPRELDGRRKVPVIMVASPYYACCGRGNESELKTYAADGSPRGFPLFYDNYFVPRGYAVVQVDMAGTNHSDGCADIGAASDIGSVKAVVDWLNGRAHAADANGRPVRASWTNGKVGMVGKSYDGALANGVAATGVGGLRTVVPISAISSWYDYTRYRGLPFYHDHPAFLARRVSEERIRHDRDCARINRRMSAHDGDESGAYTTFWSARDYRRAPQPEASRVRASVFLVHGLQDTNVKTHDLARWWSALGRQGVRRKMWISRLGHVEPFDFDRPRWVRTLHRWFDHELMGVRNGIMSEPLVRVEVAPDRWRTSDTWPVQGTPTILRPQADGRLTTGRASRGSSSFVNDRSQSEEGAITAGPDRNRLLFVTDPLSRAARIAGTPEVRLRVRTEVRTGQVGVALVDYGSSRRVLTTSEGARTLASQSCYGQRTRYDDGCYFDVERRLGTPPLQVIARGWARLRGAGRHRITLPLTANDIRMPAGHRLGLVIVGASPDWVRTVDWSVSTYRVSLRHTSLRLNTARGAFFNDGRSRAGP
ncbi:MAG: CocE/NonD family hydrolase [Chloroflexota bacterium]|nr:CocE/NonD family hydrolase [Chloroflexota bacterium]